MFKQTIRLSTEHGTFVATFSEHGLAALDFPGSPVTQVSNVSNLLYRRLPACRPQEKPQHVEPSNDQPIANIANRPNNPDLSGETRTARAAFRDDLLRWAKLTEAAINSLLKGEQPIELPPIDISQGTAFQRKVWKALQAIPLGATATYSEVAGRLGKPAAIRAVGRACGANPIPILIPCHRVLAKGNRIGGFSAGLDWKRVLLSREGIHFVEQ